MIYILECRLCARSSIAPNCLKTLQICGNCFVDPRTDLIFLNSDNERDDYA